MNSIQNSYLKSHSSSNFLLASSSYMDHNPSTAAPVVTECNQMSSINEKKIGEVWSKHNFDTNKVKVEHVMNLSNVKTWGASSGEDEGDKNDETTPIGENDVDFGKQSKQREDDPVQIPDSEQNQEEISPSHHARRPPNAFLIFCKKHRPIVRQRYPNTENRGVTKILGEWWALLNDVEKQPYNNLAKEYKDAFLSAHPDFRWYKLPAPPLRTLATRPTTISKPSPATISSPPPPTRLSEFTPGKLADESQLGGLTSLMNNNYSIGKRIEEDDSPCCKIEDNNNENPMTGIYEHSQMQTSFQDIYASPTNSIKPTLPPKPIKKRIFEQYEDEKACTTIEENISSLTNQDLLNKVVDGMFANDKDEPKEHRKSDRMCKGKRYEQFMVEGKLLGNKRETKLAQHHKFGKIDTKIDQELFLNKPVSDTPPYKLEYTIKRLAERTNVKIESDEDAVPLERTRTISETSDCSNSPLKSPPISFNLDLRIDNLASLSYDDFLRKKRESKKRKLRIKPESSKIQKLENNVPAKPETTVVPVVGSKKRKNKRSITHLNKSDGDIARMPVFVQNDQKIDDVPLDNNNGASVLPNDLLGLATLALVAARTEKIGEDNAAT